MPKRHKHLFPASILIRPHKMVEPAGTAPASDETSMPQFTLIGGGEALHHFPLGKPIRAEAASSDGRRLS